MDKQIEREMDDGWREMDDGWRERDVLSYIKGSILYSLFFT